MWRGMIRNWAKIYGVKPNLYTFLPFDGIQHFRSWDNGKRGAKSLSMRMA